MPRFFFHTQTEVCHTDVEGVEYAGYVEARQAAIRTCGQMMKDAPEIFWGSRPWTVTVTDETGLILWDIYLDGQSSAAGRSLEPPRRQPADAGPVDECRLRPNGQG
ncbi:DUF6894 family protein [Sphingomonas mollis]|uniref:DUF6894 domain-containing protein n=1 Tax=Sphingomonas mollis TaxID=2795726 RepID=A0ABS0XLE0_9SPHN|nr:hypothetical protein [Sphingomonas sp. BT553]MBJ6120848.1 hypothetical protein [Sphingomonas sp. BT553]